MNCVTSATRCSTSTCYPARAPDVSRRRQRLSGGAASLVADGLQEVQRLDQAIRADPRFGQQHDLAHPRRHEYAFPEPVVAGPEPALQFGAQVGRFDALPGELGLDRFVAFVEESKQHVLDAYVIVAMIPALLLGRAQHALRCRTETGEQ